MARLRIVRQVQKRGVTVRIRKLGSSAAVAALLAFAAPGAALAEQAAFAWFEYSGADAANAPAPTDGQYANPILQGFYPDPSVTRVGEDYYLVTSTFSYFPGIPVFRSRDLVSWTQIGNAIDRLDQLDFARLGLSRGVFAPTINHHDGVFYILNTCVDCGGNFLITATDPAGPWSDPVWLPDLEGGIDPSIFFDADGSAWITNNGPPVGTPRYDGHRAIWTQRFDIAARKTFGPRTLLVDGGVDPSTNPIWIEGPHIQKVGDWYYLTCAEGGTAEGHSQVVLRSRKPDGPYIAFEGNPILTQRGLPQDRALPVTSAGHAQLVQTPAGDWWATFLAVRPYEGDFYNTGRETFLLPVTWTDGWPRILETGAVIPYVHARPNLPAEPAPEVPMSGAFTVRDDFDTAALPARWMMMRNPDGAWYDLSSRPGTLLLDARPVELGDSANPSFLGRRQQHMDAQAVTELEAAPQVVGDRYGLAALQNDDYWLTLSITRRADGVWAEVRRRAGPDEAAAGAAVAERRVADAGPYRLQVTAKGPTYGFALAEGDGAFQTIGGDLDGKMLSTRTAGGFVGVTMGPFAISGR
ncbi:MAG: glycoside hydrolase family 43 protein [Brevundimonas sp.]|nr:MAG: glycoside hydrolase family 43 protein [Brevundimonas sp.]